MLRMLSGVSLLCVILITSCQEPASNPAPNAGLSDPVPPPYNDPDITVIDNDLHQWLAFQPAVVVRMESQPLSVEVPLRSIADDQYIIQYRFSFFEANGSLLEPVMLWERAVLEPKAMSVLKANALDQRAAIWKLQVRWAR